MTGELSYYKQDEVIFCAGDAIRMLPLYVDIVNQMLSRASLPEHVRLKMEEVEGFLKDITESYYAGWHAFLTILRCDPCHNT